MWKQREPATFSSHFRNVCKPVLFDLPSLYFNSLKHSLLLTAYRNADCRNTRCDFLQARPIFFYTIYSGRTIFSIFRLYRQARPRELKISRHRRQADGTLFSTRPHFPDLSGGQSHFRSSVPPRFSRLQPPLQATLRCYRTSPVHHRPN